MLVSWNGHGEATIEHYHKIFCDEVVNLLGRATMDIIKGSMLQV